MAFDSKSFKTRAITSVVFVIIMLTGLLWNQWSFIILFTIIHFGCWYEFVKLIKKINPLSFKLISLTGLLYITLPIILLIYIRVIMPKDLLDSNQDISRVLPCVIIFSIWINDTMAYIVGSFIGRTSFSKISPKKTWEGTVGGAILCIIVIGLISYWLNYNVMFFVIIAIICAVFGTLGDLLESKLKRMARVKDSGALMPGHGGFLDRFDSLLIATPFVALYYFLMM